LLEISLTTSAAYIYTRHPLPFLFRAAAAQQWWGRKRVGQPGPDALFLWCACYACTLLNSRTRRTGADGV